LSNAYHYTCQSISISIIQQLVSNRMFPLTLKGLEDAMRYYA
jgi:uncharacterized protein with von Willebrand factor type A (vWA) domain